MFTGEGNWVKEPGSTGMAATRPEQKRQMNPWIPICDRMRRGQDPLKCRWQVEQSLGVVPQRIELEQPEHVCPGFSSVYPAYRNSSRWYRAGFTTLVTEKTAAFQMRSCATRRHRLDFDAAGCLHSMMIHRRIVGLNSGVNYYRAQCITLCRTGSYPFWVCDVLVYATMLQPQVSLWTWEWHKLMERRGRWK